MFTFEWLHEPHAIAEFHPQMPKPQSHAMPANLPMLLTHPCLKPLRERSTLALSPPFLVLQISFVS
ncbi:hypothetical protein ACTXT7_003443 [Hymenolepis weldensis]